MFPCTTPRSGGPGQRRGRLEGRADLDLASLRDRPVDRVQDLDHVRRMLGARAVRTPLFDRVGELDERATPVDTGIRVAHQRNRRIRLAVVRELEPRVELAPCRHVEVARLPVELDAALLARANPEG